MKSPVLGLALSTVAFGASTIYLWRQLDEQRTQAQAVLAANAALNARIVELEKRRAELAGMPMNGSRELPGAGPRALPPPPSDGAPPTPEMAVTSASPSAEFRRPPEMPPAAIKMMRASVRAQHKRLYFDLQQKLGLTDAQANDLLDLLADDTAADFKRPRTRDPEAARADWEAERQRRLAAITDLLGAGKAAEFAEYEKTAPARSELLMLSQQLDGADLPLSDTQRSQLLDAMVAERQRIPMPMPGGGTATEDFAKAYNDWQSDYEKRVTDAARGIVSSEQLNTITQYQQWQRELREEAGGARPGLWPRLRGVPPAGVTAGAPGS